MRIRTIKPDFFQHEGLSDLEAQSGKPVRLAFIGLWCAADKLGRFEWRPRRLQVQILPWDNVNFSQVMDVLENAGFLVKYEVDGKVYGHIPTFSNHQRCNTREAESTLPEPPKQVHAHAKAGARTCMHTPRQVQDEGEGKGREGNKEGKGREGDIVHDDERHARSPVPVSEIVEMYHKTCPDLPKCKILTDSRKQAIRNRYNQFREHEQGPLWAFEVLFNKTAQSQFLSKDWGKCNLDWLMKQANFVKVVEGNYDNK